MVVGNCWRKAIIALMLVAVSSTVRGAEEASKPCSEDAMIVFDASGSMAGSLAEGIGAKIRRIDEVRKALAQVLPNVAHFRRIGLVTFGPGPHQQCNVELKLRPRTNTAKPIMEIVESLNPSSKTPLTQAVEKGSGGSQIQGQTRDRHRAHRRRGNLRQRALRSRQEPCRRRRRTHRACHRLPDDGLLDGRAERDRREMSRRSDRGTVKKSLSRRSRRHLAAP